MKRGDRFKVVDFDPATGTHTIEHELDDGAPMRSKVMTLEQAEQTEFAPDDGELITVEATGRDEYRVLSAKPYRGPVRASNPAYRAGWDAVFGSKKKTDWN